MSKPVLRERLRQAGLWPHQVEFVELALDLAAPARAVLSDPVGTGKSVACAVLAAELSAAIGDGFRALIVSPPVLREQWADTLRMFGNLDTLVVDAREFRNMQAHASAGHNPWSGSGVFVASYDFLKRDDQLIHVTTVPWDLVVFDELHVLLRAGTARRRLFDALWTPSSVAVAIGVSATPHEGTDPLLEPQPALRLARPVDDIKDWEGKGVGSKRESVTITYQLSEKEALLLTELREALKGLPPLITAAVLRRVGSSTLGLDELLRHLAGISSGRQLSLFDTIEDIEEQPSADQLTLFPDKEDTTENRLSPETCKRLLALVEAQEIDSKLAACESLLDEVGESNADANVVVFSDFARTAEYLAELLGDERPNTWLVTGATPLEERQEIVFEHQTQGGILVVTSGAAESLELGHAGIAIHYDVPWNPAALERRFARMERIGSRHETHKHYFLVDERSISAKIISRLGSLTSALNAPGVLEQISQLLDQHGGLGAGGPRD